MFTVYFSLKDRCLTLDEVDLDQACEALSKLLTKKIINPLTEFSIGTVGCHQFFVLFKRVVLRDNETKNYFLRFFLEFIQGTVFADLLYVSDLEVKTEEYDRSISMKSFKPENTCHDKLLDNLISPEKIPGHYLCQLSQQIMDEPVFLSTNPTIFYNKQHLTYWLYAQTNLHDPFTRQAITLNDVVVNLALKEEIANYVKKTYQEMIKKKSDLFMQIIKKYTNESISNKSIEKAFLSAAALNNVNDLTIISKKITNINCQDDQSLKGRTALHWAVKNKAGESIKWLVKHGASIYIQDTKGQSAISLARKINQTELIESLLESGPAKKKIFDGF